MFETVKLKICVEGKLFTILQWGDNSIGIHITPQLKLDGFGYVYEDLYEDLGLDKDGNRVLGLHYELDKIFVKECLTFKFGGNYDMLSARIVGTYHNMAFRMVGQKAGVNKERSEFWKQLNNPATMLNIRK